MIRVNLFMTVRSCLKTRQIHVSAEEMSVRDLLRYCETKTASPVARALLDDEGRLLPGAMILVNGQNVRHLNGPDTLVRNGADVALFPPKNKNAS